VASVLIVDDHEGTRDSYSTLLRLSGFEAETAESGAAGVQRALTRSFDVLLIDLRLPDMSGIEVIRQLKLSGVTARMVIVTAFPGWDTSFDAGAAAADGYVDGPLFGDEVVDLVNQAVNGPLPVRRLDGRTETSQPTAARERRSSVDSRVREVMHMIEAHLDDSSPIRELAARVGLSESALSHLFHASVGLSITAFRMELRMKRAAIQLITSHTDIRQIAYGLAARGETGFQRADLDKGISRDHETRTH
jgi:DNA-binding NarL/FixJ family response regulator